MLKFIVMSFFVMNIASAACELTVTKKKLEAKGAFLAGQSISAKTVEQLKAAGCKVNVKLMSVSDLIALEQLASSKRIEKLKKSAN